MAKNELKLTDVLEPEGGDFVRFLNDIERLHKKDLRGLEVKLPSNNSGMITVTSRKDIAKNTANEHAWGKNPDPTLQTSASSNKQTSMGKSSGLASLFYFLAVPILIFGVGSALFGIIDHDFEFLIPIGMFCMFFGVVGISEAKKNLKRRQSASSNQ